jgi:hypothetical protein
MWEWSKIRKKFLFISLHPWHRFTTVPTVEADADVDATEESVDNPSYVLRRLYEEVCPFVVGIRSADGNHRCSSRLHQEIAK